MAVLSSSGKDELDKFIVRWTSFTTRLILVLEYRRRPLKATKIPLSSLVWRMWRARFISKVAAPRFSRTIPVQRSIQTVSSGFAVRPSWLLRFVCLLSPHSVEILNDLKLLQIAALKLLDQGKLKLDTPISDYFPQFRNPIIIDDIKSEKPTFHPAKTVITLKHLLNFTSGLFYPDGSGDNSLNEAYHSKAMHAAEDPVSEFFRIIIVCSAPSGLSDVDCASREIFQAYR